MGFQKGMQKLGGRTAGTPNRLTASFRKAVLLAFENLGGIEGLTAWAEQNPTDFYKIAARLIPSEAKTDNDQRLTIVINKPAPESISDQTAAVVEVPLPLRSEEGT